MPIKSKKKTTITDIKGKTKKIGCLACAIQKGEVESPGGGIASSKFFSAGQDYEIPIPGFVILRSKRHIQSVDEFTAAEQQDFIKFLCRLRQGMRKALKVSVVYFFQREDTPFHFHLWLFPRYPWMEKKFGLRVKSLKPIIEYARKYLKTKKNLKKVDQATQKLKQFFSQTK